MPKAEASQGNPGEIRKTVTLAPDKVRYATKSALSLTLAYLLPMALGWAQPQTAATTVMLITATGTVSESLQKGVLRVVGTTIGAIIGLTLIAAFPQDRIVYLLCASIVVSGMIYLYNAYQGDSTVFMLAAVVTLMVFNGGDAEGAFIYGVDRAFMTVFGVLIYTVVASMLWPVRIADNTRVLAAGVSRACAQVLHTLVYPSRPPQADQAQGAQAGASPTVDEELAALLASAEAFENHFSVVKNSADGVTDYLPEWNAVLSCYEELQSILTPALKQATRQDIDYNRYIDNYAVIITRIEALFEQVDRQWQGKAGEATSREELQKLTPAPDSLRDESHLVIAAVASHAEVLERVHAVLLDIDAAQKSLLFDEGGFRSKRRPRGKPAFIWLDLENLKTALRAFGIFWIACAIWIQFNPPGGFMFVTLCTILIPLVSYTPVTPKLLIVLFSLGFLFALPAYIFLLPNLTHWLELAAFMFIYAFAGFYLFKGPVSIFYLLGLFTLGIQNSMNYQVDAFLIKILMFYMVCAMQIISIYFPFTSKPERLYRSLTRRFFHNCARRLDLANAAPGPGRWLRRLLLGNGDKLLAKMQQWAAMIDEAYFPANDPQRMRQLNLACEVLNGQLQVLTARSAAFEKNPLVQAAKRPGRRSALGELCDALAYGGVQQPFAEMQARMADIGKRLDELLGEAPHEQYDQAQLADFYVYLNLQASIMNSIMACHQARQGLDWQQLQGSRF